jgi:hypothetical protein
VPNLTVATLNVRAGGFTDYSGAEAVPPGLGAIQAAVAETGASVMGLIDTFRWREVYSVEDLRTLFGYPYVVRIDMNCARVNPKVGLTLLGGDCLVDYEPVRIYDRDCLRALLQVGGKTAQLYLTYLTSFSGARRSRQVAALLEHANAYSDIPTLIMGDLNSVRPERLAPPARWVANARQQWPWLDRRTLGPLTELYELVDTAAISALRAGGFKDELAGQRMETFHQRMFGLELRVAVDHCFSRGIPVKSCQILRGKTYQAATDHYPVMAVL